MLKILFPEDLICFKRQERKKENVSAVAIFFSSLFHSLITDGKNELRNDSVRQKIFGIRLRFLKLKI